MRNRFPGYFRLSAAKYKKAWQESIVSVDANVLLDLYRYSDETRKDLLKLLSKLKDRLWVTNRAAYEFLETRLSVIGDNIAAYGQSIGRLRQLEADFKASRGHPFLDAKTASQFFDLLERVRTHFNGKKAEWEKRINDDEILGEVEKLLNGRVGEGFSPQRIVEICEEGKKRFVEKIPPGFADSKKPEGIARYGDLIIWLELIDHAKTNNKPMIFVTADAKEDWWRLFNGRAIAARPELVAEMQREAHQGLLLYSVDGFLASAKKELSEAVTEEAVKEVKELRHKKADASVGATMAEFERSFSTAGLSSRIDIGNGNLGSSQFDIANLASGSQWNVNKIGTLGTAGIVGLAGDPQWNANKIGGLGTAGIVGLATDAQWSANADTFLALSKTIVDVTKLSQPKSGPGSY